MIKITVRQDFPGGPLVKNANTGDTGSIPGPGRFHMLQGKAHVPQLLKPVHFKVHTPQLLSPHTTTTEPTWRSYWALKPQLRNYRAHMPQLPSPHATTTEPTHHNYQATCLEKPLQ